MVHGVGQQHIPAHVELAQPGTGRQGPERAGQLAGDLPFERFAIELGDQRARFVRVVEHCDHPTVHVLFQALDGHAVGAPDRAHLPASALAAQFGLGGDQYRAGQVAPFGRAIAEGLAYPDRGALRIQLGDVCLDLPVLAVVVAPADAVRRQLAGVGEVDQQRRGGGDRLDAGAAVGRIEQPARLAGFPAAIGTAVFEITPDPDFVLAVEARCESPAQSIRLGHEAFLEPPPALALVVAAQHHCLLALTVVLARAPQAGEQEDAGTVRRDFHAGGLAEPRHFVEHAVRAQARDIGGFRIAAG